MSVETTLKAIGTIRPMLGVILFVLLLESLSCGVMAETAPAADNFDVQIYTDTQSAGWAYKTNDEAFVIQQDNCRIQWNVIQYKNEEKKRHIEVRKKCALALADQVPMHRAILKKIVSNWPLSTFESLSWGRLSQPPDWSWCVPIAVASSQSAVYADYQKNYPNSKITSLNALFVQLANETQAYKNLQQVFHSFSADIKLTSVEKVFAMKVKELPAPFASQLKRHGVGEDNRVIYDVGMSYFKIIVQ